VGNWPSEALRGQTTHMAIVAHTMPSWANPDFHYHLRNEWLVGWLAGFVRHCLDLIRVLALIYNYCSSFECAGRTICHMRAGCIVPELANAIEMWQHIGLLSVIRHSALSVCQINQRLK